MATAALTTVPLATASARTPRWLHAIAVLTAVMALPLLFLGAEVTTKQAGMVDQEGLRQPWHLWTLVSEKGVRYFADSSNWGLLIEHSHRTVGWIVGSCAIVLAVGLGLGQSRRWLRWMGLAALLAVSCQGVLGILRVKYHALAGPEIALVHGCTAQLVFALLSSVAYLTSSAWDHGFGEASADVRLKRLALLTAGFVYVQILAGAFVRHTESVVAPRLHLLAAFAVVAAAAALAASYWHSRKRDVNLSRLLFVLAGLVALQLLLGVEAWLSKFATTSGLFVPLKPLTEQPDLMRSLHLLVGSLLFACSVMVALRVSLGSNMAIPSGAAAIPQSEGAE
jgi:cytochrome c oxidase assembly protein subunit 15